jgi:hypothetical protein
VPAGVVLADGPGAAVVGGAAPAACTVLADGPVPASAVLLDWSVTAVRGRVLVGGAVPAATLLLDGLVPASASESAAGSGGAAGPVSSFAAEDARSGGDGRAPARNSRLSGSGSRGRRMIRGGA